MRPAILAVVLLLAACSQRKPPEVPPDAARQIDLFAQPWRARGTEPFWAVTVESSTLKLEEPDRAPRVAQVATRGVTEDSATWLAQAATGEVLALALTRQPCSDGMSDTRYAWTATLKIGSRELHGCAAPTGGR